MSPYGCSGPSFIINQALPLCSFTSLFFHNQSPLARTGHYALCGGNSERDERTTMVKTKQNNRIENQTSNNQTTK